jgi:hypothetical protein
MFCLLVQREIPLEIVQGGLENPKADARRDILGRKMTERADRPP